MQAAVYPFVFQPVLKDYLWGGTRIAEYFARPGGPPRCAESWEITDRPEGMSVLDNGPLAGRTLQDLLRELGSRLSGNGQPVPAAFPLLVKIIDARDRLSLQVHPDEVSAPILRAEPKTEMWYVLDAAPGAQVLAGLQPGVSREQFASGLHTQTVEGLIRSIPVTPGMSIFIPGGLVHAIGAGCLLLEVQQNSNTTYRVWDWGRVGDDGKPRPIHVDQALQTIRWDGLQPGLACAPPQTPPHTHGTPVRLVDCPFFQIESWDMTRETRAANDGGSFHLIFVASGTVTIAGQGETVICKPGRTCLLPAALASYTIRPESASRLIRVRLPAQGNGR
jgi:mannose-6-phosphate isomerase